MTDIHRISMLRLPSPVKLACRFIELLSFLLPVAPVIYLYYFQNHDLRFENHSFHEFASALALLEGTFISYVSWCGYHRSGEIFIKWLCIGFIGFTVVYSVHGAFTPIAEHNRWLFLLYGSASRVLMSLCLVISLLKFGSPPDAPEGIYSDNPFKLSKIQIWILQKYFSIWFQEPPCPDGHPSNEGE